MFIEDLHERQDITFLRALVVRVWTECHKNIDGPNLRMILRDDLGKLIDAKAFGFEAYQFVNQIKPFHYYDLSNFLVVPCNKRTMHEPKTVTNHRLVIYFTSGTIVNNESDEYLIDPIHTSLSEVYHMPYVEEQYVHVLGQIIRFTDISDEEVLFYVAGESGINLKCMGKGSCARRITKIRKKFGVDLYVCSLTYWKVLKQNGESILVSEEVSDITANPETEEAMALLERLEDEEAALIMGYLTP